MTHEDFATKLTLFIRMCRLDPKDMRDTRDLILAFFKENPTLIISSAGW